MKKELKELLANPPSEEYLDKLIKAVELWSEVKDDLPDQDYFDGVYYATSPETRRILDDLPDDNYIASVCEAVSPQTAAILEDLPDEEYLDKVIQARSISFEEE